MNTQNIETIEGAKPCLIDEQQANELNTRKQRRFQEMAVCMNIQSRN